MEACGLTGVQLHFDAAPEIPAGLRARFGRSLRILRVVHFDSTRITDSAAEHEILPADKGADKILTFASPFLDSNVDAILVDSYSLTTRGGTGQRFDWGLAAVTIFQTTGKPKVAAGGLTPENVAEAIAVLKPWGVDVVSGVEAAPGRKDPARVRAFIANALAAGRALKR